MLASKTMRVVHRGFSLIELMVVVVIIGMLATVVLFAVGGETEEARITTAEAQMRQLYDALNQYRMMCERQGIENRLPESLEGLIDGPPEWEGNWRAALRRIPNDPWGREYEYVVEDMNYGDFTLICYGRDGQEGGEGYIRMSTLRD